MTTERIRDGGRDATPPAHPPAGDLLPGIGVRLVLPGLAMIAVCYGLARFSYGLFLPEFRETFHLGPGLLGLVGAGSYVGYCLAIAASGVLCPRLGPRTVVIIAGTVCTAGMCLVAVAPTGTVLAVAVLIAGTSAGFASPPMGDAVDRRVAERHQGAANTWINSGTSIGVLVSGPVALFIGDDWRLAWFAFAAAALAVTVWCVPALPGRDRAAAPPVRGRHGGISRWVNRTTLPLLASSGAMGLVSAVYWTFSRDLVVSRGHLGDTASMVFWMVIGVSGLLGGLAGRLVRTVGLTWALRCCLAAFGAAITTLALAPGSLVLVLASGTAFGACYILLTGIYLIWSIDAFPQQPSAGIALSFALISVGQAVGAPLSGNLTGHFGAVPVFVLFGALSCLAAVVRPRKGTLRGSRGA
ncbi:MFS transporter [Streptomyces gobitricini]|uniref:MFS transporter n=1 Tax=Streptomyces gobitricini TaxID=68211 RepID=A0ABN3MFE7_9ACTN